MSFEASESNKEEEANDASSSFLFQGQDAVLVSPVCTFRCEKRLKQFTEVKSTHKGQL